MREPEAEENRIVTAGGLPIKQVSLDMAGLRRLQACGVQQQHFLRAIDNRQRIGMGQEFLAPDAGAASEFKDIASRIECFQGGRHFCAFHEPLGIVLRAAIITAEAQPPLIILAGARAVIRELFRERIVGHDGSVAHG